MKIYSVALKELGDVVWVSAGSEVLDALAPLGGERLSDSTMALRARDLEPGSPPQNERPMRAKLLTALGPLAATATARYLRDLDSTPHGERHMDHRERRAHAVKLAEVASAIDAAKTTWAGWSLLEAR